MTPSRRHIFGWALIVTAIAGFSTALPAQPALAPVANLSDNKPPTPPVVKCPIEIFREWLAKSPAERERDLTTRPPEIARRIRAKLQEYEALKPDERELRLRMTELRWYMLFFMGMPQTDRAAQVATVPEADRQLLSDRLQQWDRLPPNEQAEILKYERTMEDFNGKNPEGEARVHTIAVNDAPPSPDALNNLDKFLGLAPERRQQMYASFQRFFELTDGEKQKTLGALNVPDTAGALALQTLGNLPKDDRENYMRAFNKFSNMSQNERQEFMKNAERWRTLSPAERQAWRVLVRSLTPMPPLPPGLAPPPPMPPPPLPPEFSTHTSLPARTNSLP